MDSRIALVTQDFFIRLLKRLRDDVTDVWLHERLKLMKRITKCSGHNKDCSREMPPLESAGAAPVPLGYRSLASGKAAASHTARISAT